VSTALPPSGALPLLRALTTLRRTGQGPLSTEAWVWQAPPTDTAHLARYQHSLGYDPALCPVPLCWHYLALQRAQLALMLLPSFPYAIPGTVHLGQTLQVLAPWDTDAGSEVHITAQAEPEAANGSQTLVLRGTLHQHGVACVDSHSRYLVRRAPVETTRPPRTSSPRAPAEACIDQWDLPANTGRQYGLLSGDLNPIHLWPWSAKVLGQSQPLMHGMHSAARTEAALARHHGQALRSLSIQFMRPLLLPSHARLYLTQGGFSLWGPGNRAAAGSYVL
jgi:hypothetical protein